MKNNLILQSLIELFQKQKNSLSINEIYDVFSSDSSLNNYRSLKALIRKNLNDNCINQCLFKSKDTIYLFVAKKENYILKYNTIENISNRELFKKEKSNVFKNYIISKFNYYFSVDEINCVQYVYDLNLFSIKDLKIYLDLLKTKKIKNDFEIDIIKYFLRLQNDFLYVKNKIAFNKLKSIKQEFVYNNGRVTIKEILVFLAYYYSANNIVKMNIEEVFKLLQKTYQYIQIRKSELTTLLYMFWHHKFNIVKEILFIDIKTILYKEYNVTISKDFLHKEYLTKTSKTNDDIIRVDYDKYIDKKFLANELLKIINDECLISISLKKFYYIVKLIYNKYIGNKKVIENISIKIVIHEFSRYFIAGFLNINCFIQMYKDFTKEQPQCQLIQNVNNEIIFEFIKSNREKIYKIIKILGTEYLINIIQNGYWYNLIITGLLQKVSSKYCIQYNYTSLLRQYTKNKLFNLLDEEYIIKFIKASTEDQWLNILSSKKCLDDYIKNYNFNSNLKICK